MNHALQRHPNLLQQQNACLLIVDVQERFRAHIQNFEEMTRNIIALVKTANKLSIPIILSEQSPLKLGPTIKEILAEVNEPQVFTKNAFSCCQEESFVKHLQVLKRQQILATGIESHVCVNQTVHNLITLGYQTHLIADAISARQSNNKKVSIKKMLTAGAIISSTEMAILELLETAENKDFKYIQSLVK